MKLVIYGDFNCPYSYLASVRADVLAARGLAEIDWRAVEHDTDIAVPTVPADAELTASLAREVDDVRSQLSPGEQFTIEPPPFQPSSRSAVAAFAAAVAHANNEADESRNPGNADDLRRRLFHALWVEGRDIADPATITEITGDIAGTGDDTGTAAVEAWRSEWLDFENRLVPMLVLPDGYVSRGLGALARLAKLADQP